MTNHIPNDLSHLSNAEFNSLCPQGEHAPGPEPLSSAATWWASTTDFPNPKIAQKQIVCPKHGTHNQYISSNIKGHEGQWCMLCWLESLGPSLPVVAANALPIPEATND